MNVIDTYNAAISNEKISAAIVALMLVATLALIGGQQSTAVSQTSQPVSGGLQSSFHDDLGEMTVASEEAVAAESHCACCFCTET